MGPRVSSERLERVFVFLFFKFDLGIGPGSGLGCLGYRAGGGLLLDENSDLMKCKSKRNSTFLVILFLRVQGLGFRDFAGSIGEDGKSGSDRESPKLYGCNERPRSCPKLSLSSAS